MSRVGDNSEPISAVGSVMSEGHKKICKVFASGETCRFGKHCRYLHFRPPNKPFNSSHLHNYNGAVSRDRVATGTSSSAHKYNPSSYKGSKDGKLIAGSAYSKPDIYTSELSRKREVCALTGQRNNYQNPSIGRNWCKDEQPHHEYRNVCSVYSASGYCRYGDRCKFLHNSDLITSNSSNCERTGTRQRNVSASVQSQKRNEHNSKGESDSKSKVCSFYKRGTCLYGTDCKWLHHDTSDSLEKEKLASPERMTKNDLKSSVHRPTPGNAVFNLVDLTEEQFSQQRGTEINLLGKRYPKILKTELEKGDCYQFSFHSTDPDWPYDVKDVEMVVLFPKSYPRDPMEITLPEDQPLPNTLRRYIWKSIEQWIADRYQKLQESKQAELMFRPFAKWLDKNLEDLFTAGLKLYQKELMAQASGIELVPASQLQEEFRRNATDSDHSASSDEENVVQEIDEDDEQSSEEESNKEDNVVKVVLDPAKTGTEVKLHNLQLKENTATLMVRKIYLIIQCERCKNKQDLVTPTERLNSVQCRKCYTEQLLKFRAGIIHQFSNVLGYADVQGCIIYDVVLAECDFSAGCLKCNKDVAFGNLPPGQPKDTWCHVCHAKLRVAADCAKLLNLQPSNINDDSKTHNTGLKKPKKPPKDPAIQPGNPLPENGTCKHYKKSFRWLRFPCCGKAYPCDVCHDSNEDHENVFASRMICGYCATEQPYAGDRPCKSCNAYVVKKFTEHWEGGKGCRDKIKMSRSDERKYSNQNKTVSRKAQSKQTTGKKNIKIRHN